MYSKCTFFFVLLHRLLHAFRLRVFVEFDSKSGWNCSPCCTSVVGEGRDGVKSHLVLEEEEEGGAKRKREVLFGGREKEGGGGNEITHTERYYVHVRVTNAQWGSLAQKYSRTSNMNVTK